mmetsp:Transcript_21542/g.67574  ORF Transcript_21542/g.67574 Transcript_21542/m.67574 type:complete len:496 (-) Transcript_21542:781-2268(-)
MLAASRALDEGGVRESGLVGEEAAASRGEGGECRAAEDAAAAALELRLDEAVEVLEDMIMVAGYGGGYEEEASHEVSSSSPFLGAWVVTDDSHEMSDSGGEESIQAKASKKSRKRAKAGEAVVSGDEQRKDKQRRRSDRKRSGKPSKRAKTAKAVASLVPSVSATSLSDAASSATTTTTCRVRLTKPKPPKPELIEPAPADEGRAAAPAPAEAPADPPADDDAAVVGIQCLPERAEYRCTLCSEEYSVPSLFNPWWALVRHECPKCHKQQFPSINIASPANQITFSSVPSAAAAAAASRSLPAPAAVKDDPIAANASTDDDDTESNANFSTVDDDDLMFLPPKRAARPTAAKDDDDDGDRREPAAEPDAAKPQQAPADKEDEPDTVDLMIEALARSLPDDCKLDEVDVDDLGAEAPRPPNADLSRAEAQHLFDLFEHARYCSGNHRSSRHAHLCACTKFVMLHLRDCAGTLPNGGGPCPFSWCGPCRRALAQHLA